MLLDPHALIIVIDGSAYNNPGGKGGCHAIARWPDEHHRSDAVVVDLGYSKTTNNRMELLACIKVFAYLSGHRSELGVQRVIIVTDSKYVYEGHRIVLFWRSNKWRTRDGRPVDNADLWKQFLSARSKVTIRHELRWHQGKASELLKAVDRGAKDAAKTRSWNVDRGFREGKIGRSKVAEKSSSTLFSAQGQTAIIRIYKTRAATKNENLIYFDCYSELQRAFVAKHRAYVAPVTGAELHRGHCYRVQFNASPKYPFIEEVVEEVMPVVT